MSSQERKVYRVAVVGGGFAGASAYRVLKDRDNVEVMVYDRLAFREFTPSILRALVHPEHSSFILKSTVGWTAWKAENVVSVEHDAIIGNEGSIPFDFCIVSTGSAYDAPIKASAKSTTVENRKEEIFEWHRRIVASEQIVIVGGGTVGVELAAEIASVFPTKNVTIITSKDNLLDGTPESAQAYAAKFMQSNGVRLIFNEKVDIPENSGDPTIVKSFKLSDGSTIEADLVFKCIGFHPNNEIISEKNYPRALINNKLHVDNKLRLIGSECVYAVGDVAMIPDEETPKTVLPATWSADAAAENVLAAINSLNGVPDSQKRYPAMRMANVMCISLYSRDGIFIMDDWLVVTGFFAAFMKWFLETFGVMVMRGNFIAIGFMEFAAVATLHLANVGHTIKRWITRCTRRE
eukprot:CFRG7255T1